LLRLTHITAPPREKFARHDARSVLARSYGCGSWPKLKAAVDGVTAARLHEAVESGDLETTRQLLARRPEIVDLGRGDMRAVHMAVLRRDLETTKLLLEFGADPDGGIWPNRDATGPFVIARDGGYQEIVDVIETSAASRRRRGRRPGCATGRTSPPGGKAFPGSDRIPAALVRRQLAEPKARRTATGSEIRVR
jgi:hypothetical protein